MDRQGSQANFELPADSGKVPPGQGRADLDCMNLTGPVPTLCVFPPSSSSRVLLVARISTVARSVACMMHSTLEIKLASGNMSEKIPCYLLLSAKALWDLSRLDVIW